VKRGIGAVIVAAAALAGCGGREPGVYDITAAEAYTRLHASDLREMVFAHQCGILIHARPEGVPGRSVTWRVYSSGREMVNFTATLTPVGETRTRADISVSRAASGGEAYDGSQTYPRPALRQPLRPAIEEQVAALLEGRQYDAERVPRGQDPVCNVQRAGLENGRRFRVDDIPSMDASQSAAARRARQRAGWGG
jgi:hypothetical protein